MSDFNLDFWLLVLSTALVILLFIYLLRRKNNIKNQLRVIFIMNIVCTLIISLGVLIQAVCAKLFNIDPIIFENFIYIGTCFSPVSVFFTSLVFVNSKIKFKKKYLLLFIVPILSLIVLWTNNYHHLFYVKYSQSFSETVNGPYMYVHTLYTYLLMGIGIIRLLYFSIKNSGFFSKQSLLIILGLISPLLINVLGGVLKVIPMTVFATPIAFSITMICFALAIFKFDFLKVAPIALQRIVDRMSDSYIVVNENNVVTDFNQTFLDLFKVKAQDIRNKNLEELFDKYNEFFEIKKDLILRFCRKGKAKT